MIDDERFFAWLDGELGPAEAAEVQAAVAADPQLQRLAEQHRALRVDLQAAFDPVAAAPIPERLEGTLRSSAPVVDFAAEKAKRNRGWPVVVQWTALAATLAIGLLAGSMIPRGDGAPVEVQGGKLYAAASLNRALDTELASMPQGDVRIGLTFRGKGGEICRTFNSDASSGLACRSGHRWRLRGLFASPEGQGGDYRMAASMDPALATLVDSTMVGEPFDALGEKAAKAQGWK